MTIMEIVITIIWMGYGLFSAYQADLQDEIALVLLAIALSPIILIWRAFYGIFSRDVF